jgi:hypothetical protein
LLIDLLIMNIKCIVDQLPIETNSDNCLSPLMFENDNESHNEGKYLLLHKYKCHTYYR